MDKSAFHTQLNGLLDWLGIHGALHDAKTLLIMRGLPGSGKTTVVDALRERLAPGRLISYSPDDYFMSPLGTYVYDVKQLDEAHTSCFKSVAAALERGGIDVVVVDSTNSKRAHYMPYVMLGRAFDRSVRMVNMILDSDRCCERTPHGVPPRVIYTMSARWEDREKYDPQEYRFYSGT